MFLNHRKSIIKIVIVIGIGFIGRLNLNSTHSRKDLSRKNSSRILIINSLDCCFETFMSFGMKQVFKVIQLMSKSFSWILYWIDSLERNQRRKLNYFIYHKSIPPFTSRFNTSLMNLSCLMFATTFITFHNFQMIFLNPFSTSYVYFS